MSRRRLIQEVSQLQQRLAFAWLMILALCVVSVVLAFGRGYNFDTSILALLPASSQQHEAAADVDEHLAEMTSQRMLFLVSHEDPATSLTAAGSFSDVLASSTLFSEVQGRINEAQSQDWLAVFQAHRYRLMTDQDRQRLIENEMGPGHPVLQQALARLYSPMAASVAPQLVNDPLQLFFNWQLAAAPKSAFSLENDWLTRHHEGRSYRMVVATLAGNPYELEFQQAVLSRLAEAESALPKGAEVLRSGLMIHAAHGAAQARQEISTIGIGSVLGITLLMLLCFRRVGDLLLVFVPIAAGWLLAFATSMLMFERLHMVTMAFGASLIGVATDYSLHYLCGVHEAHPESKRSVLRRIFPALSLGVASSILAYAAQGMAPFPGLRQMAFFSVMGLLGAWLTVVLCFPLLVASSREPKGSLHPLARTLGIMLDRWPTVHNKVALAVIVCVVAVALLQIGRMDFDDQISKLQTSPQALLNEDRQVQVLTQSINPSQYLLLSAADEETLLQREEALSSSLREMAATGLIQDYHAVSRWLPSLQRQQEHLDLYTSKIFAEHGLADLLADRIGASALAGDMREQFAENPQEPFTLNQWLSSPAGKTQSHLWFGERRDQVHSLVLVAGLSGADGYSTLAALGDEYAGVEFVDRLGTITTILKENRQQLQFWIAFAYVLVFLLLSRRYGWSAWRILAAPAIASLSTLAILSACGATVNIFNLLALLLVLGIGLDAGIFLWESARNAYSWAAISLANATTLLAFGLLALSNTPVLHQFGITVLLGVSGAWLLAPCFVRTELTKLQKGSPKPAPTVTE